MSTIDDLRAAGFSDDEVNNWVADKQKTLSDAGFSQSEINSYFGVKEPNMDPAQKFVEQAVRNAAQANHDPESGQPKKPFTFVDALEAGLQSSVSGLLARGKAPDRELPQDASAIQRIAANSTQMIGDLPAMAAGFALGGGAGAETGPGAVVTGTAGAFALPTALRSTLMDSYKNGSMKSFSDFWDRFSAIMTDTAKSWVTGAATGGAGAAVGGALKTAAPALRTTAQTASEIGTMVTVGKALEGQVPNAQDFTDAAVLLLGAKGAAKGVGKLQDIYAKTGRTPTDVVQDAEKNPTIVQDILSTNKDVPTAYESLADNGAGEAEKPAEPAAEPVPRTDAEKAVLDRISVGEGDSGKGTTWDDFYTAMVNQFNPLREAADAMAEGKPVPTALDPEKLALLSRGSVGKATQFLEYSPFKFDTYENVGQSLKDVLAPVKDDLDGFRAFAVAKRSLELNERGIETGVPLEEAKQVVEGGNDKFQKAFQGIQEYQDNLVSYLKDAGIISPEMFEKMREANQDYVPFYRLMDDKTGGPGGAGRGLRARQPIKSIQGSERQIVDPLESIVKNTYLYTNLAERNAVHEALVSMAEQSPVGDQFVKKVPTPMRPINVESREIAKFMQEHGMDTAGLPEDSMTVFRPNSMVPTDNQIAVYRDGQRQIYEVTPELAKAMNGLDQQCAGMLMKLLSAPARLLRAGATLSPDFMLRNPMRDQISAFVFSKDGYMPLLDLMRGAASLFKRDDDYQNWLKSGGANAAMVSLDRDYIQNEVAKLTKDTGLLDNAINVVRHPIEALRVVSEFMENATRLGLFKRSLGDATDKDAIQNAGLAARDGTLDFARMGAQTRALNMLIAFWNAQVQGVDKAARAFKEDPIGTMTKVGAAITLPSVMLWYANHDDPRYKDLPNWQKDLFWIVMTKDHIYRIPKPFELGILFGSGVERMLDAVVDKKDEAFKNFGGSAFGALTPGYLPTFATPMLEQMTNHSFFSGHALIPHGLEKLLPEYQYSEYTSETSKALGQLVGAVPGMHDSGFASPTVIDNYIRQWSGGLGTYIMQVADAGLRKAGALPDPVKPANTLADIPFVKAFVVRYPSAQAQSIQDFMDNYSSEKRVMDTVKEMAKRGDPDAAFKELQLEPTAAMKLDDINAAIGNGNKTIQMIYRNPDMTPDDKRQLIDTVYKQMIEMAGAGNQALKEAHKVLDR